MGKKSHRATAHESCLNPPSKPLIRFCPVHDGALPDGDKCPVCHHIEKYRTWQRRAKDGFATAIDELDRLCDVVAEEDRTLIEGVIDVCQRIVAEASDD